MFDPNKSFFELGVVQFFVVLIAVLSGLSFYFVNGSLNVELTLDYEGFQNLLNYYKFPIGILATLIPIIAMLAANHRSEQTRTQINISMQQNNFANYYKHLEEFSKYCDDHLEPYSKIRVESKTKIHSFLFPDSSKGDFRVKPEFHGFISEKCSMFLLDLDTIRSGNINEDVKHSILNELMSISGCLRIHLKDLRNGMAVNIKGIKVNLPHGNFIHCVASLYQIMQLLDEAASFDAQYFRSQSCQDLLNFDLSTLGDLSK